jgi:hypothetical protein
MLGHVGSAQGPREACPGQSDVLGGIADFLAIAGHHDVDRAGNVLRNALGRPGGTAGWSSAASARLAGFGV